MMAHKVLSVLFGFLALHSIFAVGASIGSQGSQRQCEANRYEVKPRIFVCTDMSNEPDDQMSLVRFLTYENEFDVQGIAGTTPIWKNDSLNLATIRTVISAYGNVTTQMNANVPSYAPYPEHRTCSPRSTPAILCTGWLVSGKTQAMHH